MDVYIGCQIVWTCSDGNISVEKKTTTHLNAYSYKWTVDMFSVSVHCYIEISEYGIIGLGE